MGTSGRPFTLKLRFSPELESAFQFENYENNRNFLRGLSLLFCLMAVVQIFRFQAAGQTHFLFIPLTAIPVAITVFGLTLMRDFWRCWQPILLALLLFSMCSIQVAAAHNIQAEPGYADIIARVSWFSTSTIMFMVALAPIRFNFPYASALYLGLAFNCGLTCIRVYGAPLSLVLDRFSLGIFAVAPALMYLSYTHERLHRGAFLARQHLAEREAEERRRRQQTETMLSVLSQAIGGIVHDLGNPLTLVQSGVDVLRHVVNRSEVTPAALNQMLTTIHGGAVMLNYLRISLIEQTRVLEGKPIPVALNPVTLRTILDAGLRYQKPALTHRRQITVEGEDVQLLADEVKLITVFMNLIGNALKYSDGEVRITWRQSGEQLLVAVQDQGTEGRGLTREQIGSLFVAFGRLAAHEAIEGTGLGLLSVQKIVEAHGGETFVEGRENGGLFSTARGSYPSLLAVGFQTAFVVACPIGIRLNSAELGTMTLESQPEARLLNQTELR
jgi:signal transduction histidine kinase